MADTDKILNPQHFGSDSEDIRIRIRISVEIFESCITFRLSVEVRRLGGGLRSLGTVCLAYCTALHNNTIHVSVSVWMIVIIVRFIDLLRCALVGH